MYDALQILGALLVLAPFVALQFGRLRTDSLAYLWPNLLGGGLLAVLAASRSQWGFLLLEGVWALVAARSLMARSARRVT